MITSRAKSLKTAPLQARAFQLPNINLTILGKEYKKGLLICPKRINKVNEERYADGLKNRVQEI